MPDSSETLASVIATLIMVFAFIGIIAVITLLVVNVIEPAICR